MRVFAWSLALGSGFSVVTIGFMDEVGGEP